MRKNGRNQSANDQNDLEIEVRETFLLNLLDKDQEKSSSYFCSMKVDCDEGRKEIFAVGYMEIKTYTVMCRENNRAEVRKGLRTIGKMILQSNIKENTDIINFTMGICYCIN